MQLVWCLLLCLFKGCHSVNYPKMPYKIAQLWLSFIQIVAHKYHHITTSFNKTEKP